MISTTAFARFRSAHPGSRHARADIVRPAVRLAAALAFGAVALCLTLDGLGLRGGTTSSPLELACAAVCLGALVWCARGSITALRVGLGYRRRGTLAWAIGDGVCLLVDGQGRAIEFALTDVRRVRFDGTEVALELGGEHSGLVYAALFDLFDGSLPGPSVRRFYACLADALKSARPDALEPEPFGEAPESVEAVSGVHRALPLSWPPGRIAG